MLLRVWHVDMRYHSEAVAMVQTVCNTFRGYTKNQVEKYILACKFQSMIVHPTKDKLKQMVSSKLLTNCPVLTNNTNNAHAIFGPQRAGIRGGGQ